MRNFMRRRAVLLGVVAAVVSAIVVLLATGLGRDPSSIASPLVGRAAPDFTLSRLDGPALTLSTLRGQVVVVNFWASWCAECHTEQAALDQTWKKFQDSGVVVVGVNFQDTTDDASDYVRTAGVSYPVVEDADSHTALAYGLRGVPETFIVDKAGRIVDRIIGPVDATRLSNTISSLLTVGARWTPRRWLAACDRGSRSCSSCSRSSPVRSPWRSWRPVAATPS